MVDKQFPLKKNPTAQFFLSKFIKALQFPTITILGNKNLMRQYRYSPFCNSSISRVYRVDKWRSATSWRDRSANVPLRTDTAAETPDQPHRGLQFVAPIAAKQPKISNGKKTNKFLKISQIIGKCFRRDDFNKPMKIEKI